MSATNGRGPLRESRSYHGQPVIKEPIWKPEIPWYLFLGGLGGASAGLAWLAELRGNDVLARRAWTGALLGTGLSPALLISDLGRPARFVYMLRMFKVTSPMSVGSWVLFVFGGASSAAGLDALLGPAVPERSRGRVLSVPGARTPGLRPGHVRPRRHPPDRPLWRTALGLAAVPARPAAALAGLPLATYTGALLAQTAVPVWHEARRELPALFAAGAAASAGAYATALTPVEAAGAARRLAVIGCVAELAVIPLMEQRLGELGEPYHQEAAGAYGRLARGLTISGALLLAARAGRSRPAAVVGGALVLAGAACERWSVFKAGFQSARDPKHTVAPQRRRIDGGLTRGASRRVVPVEQAPAAPADPAPRPSGPAEG
jgi:formate-dependent nitrite reductase membrane component NrfD